MANRRIAIDDFHVDCEFISVASDSAPTIVFLHEGLGSIAMWRDFPLRVARASACNAWVYSRRGHGRSDPLAAPHRVGFMHDEALTTLPALLEATGVRNPILFGHSSGASIALIHAGGAARPVAGVIALAPHVIVEEITVRTIAAADVAYRTTDLREKLGRHHPDPTTVFNSWTHIWLNPAFRAWNIEDYVRGIACPVLAVQGTGDEYGTMDQIERIARLARDAELLKLDECGHSPHRDRPEAVIEATTRFTDRLRTANSVQKS